MLANHDKHVELLRAEPVAEGERPKGWAVFKGDISNVSTGEPTPSRESVPPVPKKLPNRYEKSREVDILWSKVDQIVDYLDARKD